MVTPSGSTIRSNEAARQPPPTRARGGVMPTTSRDPALDLTASYVHLRDDRSAATVPVDERF